MPKLKKKDLECTILQTGHVKVRCNHLEVVHNSHTTAAIMNTNVNMMKFKSFPLNKLLNYNLKFGKITAS